MDNEKLIAQISSSEEAWVDRVNLRRSKNTSLSSHMSLVDELRKKTIHIEGMAKSRFTKLRLQESFEKLKNHLHFEYGDNLILNLKSNEITIYSRWIEGVTLRDNHQKEEPLKPDDIGRLKNRLKLWVRIFEHLSFFHTNGIIHGNIKPENILIRDRSTVDAKYTYNSEFFDKKTDIPHVALLDGGYSHFIEFQKESIEYELTRSKISTEKKLWLAPEAHGFLEGSFKENSDVFSLAAVMAWDLGLIEISNHSILHSLWSIYNAPEANSFCLGNKFYKWPSRNSLTDTFKRLRTILLRALEPLSEKRTISARDIAFEIMLMANRLVDTMESSPSEVANSQPRETLPLSSKKEILLKNFDLPDKILPFLLNEEKAESNRLWIEARNKTANKHSIMRSMNSGLNIIGLSSFYFGIKTTQSKIPFYNLDFFCNNLLSYVLHINPQFLEEMRAIFTDIGSLAESIFFVLPSLRYYSENIQANKLLNKNNIIQVQHESIQKNIENIITKIIYASKLSYIIIDDINRSDHSSISIILKLLSSSKIKLKWIIGIRLDEDIDSEITKKNLFQLKYKDLSFASLKDNRTISYWITKLNTLSKPDAKMLSIFSINPTAIDIETFEILSNKFIGSSGNIMNENILVNEKTREETTDDDLIPSEDQASQSKPTTDLDLNEEKQNKDSLFLAADVLKRAINLGLITENRDISTGHLVSYYWEHQFVLQCLSMLLHPDVKAEIYHSLFNIYQNNIKETGSLAKIINITDCLMKSKVNQSHLGAYSSLILAAEELCDIYSAEYIIKKLQLLEEQIEIDRPKDASILIPKIREKIADISRSINKNEIAVKYYDAVSWNVMNRKKRSILMLKSFFPAQIRNRELRIKEYYRILTIAEKSGFFPKVKYIPSFEITDEIINIIYKIQKKLSDESSYLENTAPQNNKDLFKKSLENINKMPEEIPDELTYKSSRDKVMSYFLRSCVGWIDNYQIYPYVIKSLHLAAENNDGESTIHLLFTLLLTCERNIPLKLRNIILETITELVGRIGSTFTLYEVLLTRAWLALFYDGNLAECKKHIERLNSSYYELPHSIRQCTKKLQILYEFETLSAQSIQNPKELSEKYSKKFQDYELSDWNIGYDISHIKSVPANLKSIPGDSLFVGNILNEKIDQILLYSHFLIEDGHANAASLVCNEAKNINIRQWFIDPSSHIEYLPEKLAINYIEFTLIKNIEMGQSDKSKYYRFKENLFKPQKGLNNIFIRKYLNKLKSLFIINKLMQNELKSEISYWGEDKAVLDNLKLDLAKTQDTERLHFLAQSLIRSGFLWSGFRVAHKARCGLATIFNEIRESENSKQELQQNLENSNNKHSASHRQEENPISYQQKPIPYPEQGIALNYILEFLHNFQHLMRESKLSYEELREIAEFIKKSIPKETDLIESTLAGAIKASAKRFQVNSQVEQEDSFIEETEHLPIQNQAETESSPDSDVIRLPKAG